MSYLHINNLYKDQRILLFKECYAMEKIHGTSTHLRWKDGQLSFFSGGIAHLDFVALFNHDWLIEKIRTTAMPDLIIYGEAYGGKCQGMSGTYGKELRFIAFEVKIGDSWLSVPQAKELVESLGLEFVDYRLISTDLLALDAERDRESIQAIRNGIGPGKKREGIVLRAPIEVVANNGERIIAKHKAEDFSETKTVHPMDIDKLAVLNKAQEIADEWATEMRLTHVLDAFPNAGIEKTGDIIRAMIADIEREGKDEIENFKEAKKIIGTKTAQMFKRRLR